MTHNGEKKVRWRRPACDIYESAEGTEIYADVPGARRQDLTITIEAADVLVETRMPEGETASRVPQYRRRFPISANIDTQGIRAQLREGVLQLTLPLRKESAARTIDIEE